MYPRKAGLGAALFAATIACGGGSSNAGVGSVAPTTRDSVTLSIDNQNFYDANVYYQFSGAWRRLGTVNGNTKTSFRLRWEATNLLVRVDFIGAGSAVTDALALHRDEFVEIRVPTDAHSRSDRLRRVR
jgi:hypothetical protein